jgi:hypothetical protein
LEIVHVDAVQDHANSSMIRGAFLYMQGMDSTKMAEPHRDETTPSRQRVAEMFRTTFVSCVPETGALNERERLTEYAAGCIHVGSPGQWRMR